MQIDGLVASRDGGDMHEATRRLLSLLLQHIEGFHGKTASLFIGATNRPQDLDSALLSRFDLIINYPMPDFDTRIAIFGRYAKQFANNVTVMQSLSTDTDGFSCRDIKEVCEHAERKFAAQKINNKAMMEEVPRWDDYNECIKYRKRNSVSGGNIVQNYSGEV